MLAWPRSKCKCLSRNPLYLNHCKLFAGALTRHFSFKPTQIFIIFCYHVSHEHFNLKYWAETIKLLCITFYFLFAWFLVGKILCNIKSPLKSSNWNFIHHFRWKKLFDLLSKQWIWISSHFSHWIIQMTHFNLMLDYLMECSFSKSFCILLIWLAWLRHKRSTPV